MRKLTPSGIEYEEKHGYTTFRNRKTAQTYIQNEMQGWDARPVKVTWYVGDGTGNWAWAIRCDDNKMLRNDGFVK